MSHPRFSFVFIADGGVGPLEVLHISGDLVKGVVRFGEVRECVGIASGCNVGHASTRCSASVAVAHGLDGEFGKLEV